MHFYTIDDTFPDVTSEQMPSDLAQGNRRKQIAEKLTPVLIHLSSKLPNRAGEVDGLLDPVDQCRHIENCIPELVDVWVLFEYRDQVNSVVGVRVGEASKKHLPARN